MPNAHVYVRQLRVCFYFFKLEAIIYYCLVESMLQQFKAQESIYKPNDGLS